jgi:hypothetical protein
MRLRVAVLGSIAVLAVIVTAGVASGQPNQPVPARAARNARVARRDVRRLLAKLVLPAGATLTARNPGGVALASSSSVPGSSALIDVHRFWRVAGEDPAAVLSWFQAHAPAGSSLTTSGSGSGPGFEFNALGFSFPDITGVLDSRELGVTIAAARGGGTAIRADAQDVYWIPKPRWERVPAGVQQIDVSVQRLNESTGDTTTTSQTVTNASQIATIVSLVNALPPAQPWVLMCPADLGPTVMLNFLSAPGAAPLATAVAGGSGCGEVSFTLHGKTAPGLSDGPELDTRLGHLLGFSG